LGHELRCHPIIHMKNHDYSPDLCTRLAKVPMTPGIVKFHLGIIIIMARNSPAPNSFISVQRRTERGGFLLSSTPVEESMFFGGP
jgi:hypothetical protein